MMPSFLAADALRAMRRADGLVVQVLRARGQLLGIKSAYLAHAHAARSTAMPCQVTNPSAANGAAPAMHAQESSSSLRKGDSPK